jgi:phosphocarrier protein
VTDAIRRTVTIANERGLHARASAKFVSAAQMFEASVRVRRGQEVVDASSIMDLLMLAAGPGSEIEIEARGPEADAALAALCGLVESKFGEAS